MAIPDGPDQSTPVATFPAFSDVRRSDPLVSDSDQTERPIRFPHLPPFLQTPAGAAQYHRHQQQLLRVDSPHPSVAKPVATNSSRDAMEQNAAADASDLASSAAFAEQNTEKWAARPTEALAPNKVSRPTLASDARQTTCNGINARQVEQIADYLLRKRNELESEQTDLQLTAWRQQQDLLLEKEQLRGQHMKIQIVQATLEMLRRQLIDFGEMFSRTAGEDLTLQDSFTAVCRAYSELAEVARSLDASV